MTRITTREHPFSAGGAEPGGDSLRTKLEAQIYFALRRSLSQSQRDKLKRKLASGRQRFKRAYLLAYGKFTTEQLVQEIRSRVDENFEILMVHSSYDSLLPMYQGNPQELISALLEYCGKDRTLAMPAFVFGGRLYDKKQFFSSRPFDSRRTPSEVGLLTEIFRRTPGVLRSLHPTHSVCAIGPLARPLTAGHHLAGTRVGRGTPFDTMTQKRTAILGLGVHYFRCLTQTHTPEDILGGAFPVPFEREPFPVVLVDENGKKLQYDLVIPRTSFQMDNTVLRSLLPQNALTEWKFHGTPMFVTEAAAVTECLLAAAGRGVTVYKTDSGKVRATP